MESRDQKLARRAVRACGGRQALLAARMGISSARAVVSLLLSGDRGITLRVGRALVVATQGTDDPLAYADVFPELFEPIPGRDEWPRIVAAEELERIRRQESRAESRERRRRVREMAAGRAAA